jgi:cell fate regulator YaaT (PSP1 superfamily)
VKQGYKFGVMMNGSSSPYIIGVQFQKIGKLYHFDSTQDREVLPGDFVIVETSRGKQLGHVIQIVENPQPPPEGSWKAIQRKATPQDLVIRQSWQQKETEAIINCRAKASELGITDVKFINAEFSFDGNKLIILYSNESGERQELKEIRRAMQRSYSQTQIEFHVIGPRDVAKILGGMGACGLEKRCCTTFLTDFSPISIKMAKEQGISLSPTEITGMCGRLRCCLVYEYEQYVEARKQLPKRGKRVTTSMGEGKVIDVFPLKSAVLVELDTGNQGEFMKHELQPLEELEALKQKSNTTCKIHPEGGCNCSTKPDRGRHDRKRK